MPVHRIGVSVPPELLEEFDRTMRKMGSFCCLTILFERCCLGILAVKGKAELIKGLSQKLGGVRGGANQTCHRPWMSNHPDREAKTHLTLKK